MKGVEVFGSSKCDLQGKREIENAKSQVAKIKPANLRLCVSGSRCCI